MGRDAAYGMRWRYGAMLYDCLRHFDHSTVG